MPPKNQQSGQYDFIMGGGQKATKPSIALPTNNTPAQRLVILLGIFAILIVFFFIVMGIIRSGGEDKATYITLSQQQAELARVAALGVSEASANQSIKNTSINIQASVTSDQKALIAALANKGVTLKGKDLTSIPNQATDKRLADAKAAANFDSTMITILNEQLEDYRSRLEQTYDSSKSQSLKDTLGQAYKHTDLLQKQLSATRP